MRTKMTFLVIGLVLGVGLTLAIAAEVTRNEIGRYTVSLGDKKAYIIDTATGELWERQPGMIRRLGTITQPVIGEPVRVAQMSAADQEALANALTGFLP